jgi:hypothetical protein
MKFVWRIGQGELQVGSICCMLESGMTWVLVPHKAWRVINVLVEFPRTPCYQMAKPKVSISTHDQAVPDLNKKHP